MRIQTRKEIYLGKRGLIFSIDAIYAVVFLTALAAAFSFYYSNALTDSAFVENLNNQATDTALVAFYLNKNSSNFEGFSSTFVDANYSKCVTIYNYTPTADSSPAQTAITTKQFCRGFG